jgi:glutathione S-transferase
VCTPRPFCTTGARLRALTRRPPPAQVPIIQDGDKVVNDSFAIAQYLERTYPDRPSLFGGPGGAPTLPVRPARPPFSARRNAGLHIHASLRLVSFLL